MAGDAIKTKGSGQLTAQQQGRIKIMTKHLKNNTTPKQYSMSGINLPFKEVRLLAETVSQNTSLIQLHISRKGITD